MFERSRTGIVPTAACKRFYNSAIEAMHLLKKAEMDARMDESKASGIVSGIVNTGLMPVFTRSILPNVLAKCTRFYPYLDIRVSESYSRVLTDMVKAQKLDFALVPSFIIEDGLVLEHFATDLETLVCSVEFGKLHGLKSLSPVKLCELQPLDIIVPGQTNVRYNRLNEYFSTNGVRINRMMELDSMMGTLELITRGSWVAILPRMICHRETEEGKLQIHPLESPELKSEFVVISPKLQPMSHQAEFLLQELKSEYSNLYAKE